MSPIGVADDITWAPPGAGTWTFDAAHNVGPVTPIVQEVFPAAMAEGFRSFTARYGFAISHIDVAYVNGYAYSAVRVAGVPISDRPPPPAPVMRVVSRLVPELRRRDRAARIALQMRPWRADLDRWFAELRPARLDAVRSIQSVDPVSLDDAELADHLVTCVEGLRSGLREHFGLVGAAGLPVGLYLQREATRGRSVTDSLADLRGAAGHSTAATVPALAAIAEALRSADAATPSSFAEVRNVSADAASALDSYLDEYGQRIVGAFDVTGRRLIETPDIVLRSITAASGRSDVATMPPTDDVVVDDARLAIASRDDHAGISCMWPLGLLRRAVLAVGERVAADGRLEDGVLAFDARTEELVALLRGTPRAPSSSTLDVRRTRRLLVAGCQPPPTLGVEIEPPDPMLFPAGLRAIATAMRAFVDALETVDTTGDPGRGVGIGTQAYRGRAVVAADPDDAIARMEPGDVLVTGTTTPAFNTVLVLAGALVTAHGGPMSHAGIVSRELGIPAVLGYADALSLIPDGADVEVDPVAATVRLVADDA